MTELQAFKKFVSEDKFNNSIGVLVESFYKANQSQVKQQEDKISDEDLEKLGAKYALNEYGYVGQEMHKRDFIKGFKFKACLQKGYNEDKPVWTDEQIEQIAEKLYPTLVAPFDKNNFKERNGFIKGLKYSGSDKWEEKLYSHLQQIYNSYADEWTEHQNKETADLLHDYQTRNIP